MNEAIKLAIEKGGYSNYRESHSFPARRIHNVGYITPKGEPVILDPLFWHSLGKALGNKDEMICDSPKCDSKLCEYAGYKDPKRMFDSYMEYIWYGYDTNKFWKELLNQ